jgi:hypothetical protein
MTAYRITVVELHDLEEITVTCGCKMRLSLPVETGILPDRCPSCNNVFDEHLKKAFAAAGRIVREGKASDSGRIQFAAREPIDPSSPKTP